MRRSIFRIGQAGDRPLSPLPPDSPPVVQALRYGITAPSAHNTQPWRIDQVSDTEARLYFDPARRLPATDPPGRQVHISHGTLIEMTAIAATSLGYRTEAELLPDGEMTTPNSAPSRPRSSASSLTRPSRPTRCSRTSSPGVPAGSAMRPAAHRPGMRPDRRRG